jgi:hypothetical protein
MSSKLKFSTNLDDVMFASKSFFDALEEMVVNQLGRSNVSLLNLGIDFRIAPS